MSAVMSPNPGFRDLSLIEPVLRALDDVGYESPSPIQAAIIPSLLAGRDVIGQAQTGTGKTAAFALPILSRIDLSQTRPQALILAPTRELAIQVAEAFQRYAAHLRGFHVLPIYGGQDYQGQLKQLKRGPHVVVGTPGRVMDHMRRGTLNLGTLRTLVLDEADEMLRMGFIDDVEWILTQTPPQRQIALFSATMPNVIRRIAQTHLRDAEEISIKVRTTTADTIRQRYWMVSGTHKLDALTRILEAETFDGILVFVRTKTATLELAEKLEARGYATAALNGDIQQKLRERTIDQLKSGKIDILVATDVAARGLDVERISHVINYDIPNDTEAYVHRIGRTGRAGRSGEAILFVAPREKRMLRSIEQATRQRIDMMELPSTETINDKRVARFYQRITDTLAENGLAQFQQLMESYQNEHNVPPLDIAAALAKLLQGDQPLLLKHRPADKPERGSEMHERKPAGKPERLEARHERKPASARPERGERPARAERPGQAPHDTDRPARKSKPEKREHVEEIPMEAYRIEVGHEHGVKPANIVGAIANEVGLDSAHIGRIEILTDHSTVDLPEGMPGDVFQTLKKTRVCGRPLQISRLNAPEGMRPPRRKPALTAKPKGKPKHRKGGAKSRA